VAFDKISLPEVESIISFLEEFKNNVDNSNKSNFEVVISELNNFLVINKRKELLRKELETLQKSKWNKVVLLSALELGGITAGLLRRGFKKNSGFFYEIIKRLVDKGYLKEASNEEKLVFIRKNQQFLRGIGQYHIHKLRVFLLTPKGIKIARTLQQLEEKQEQFK